MTRGLGGSPSSGPTEPGWFDTETAVEPTVAGRWSTEVSEAWHIGDNANGGYALSPVLRALRSLGSHDDPISVTAQFLRPVQGPGPAVIVAESVRSGRTTAVARGSLQQCGSARLAVLAAFGTLRSAEETEGPVLELPAPSIPRPDECVGRAGLEQGVDLPILRRLDVRIDPAHAVAGGSAEAKIDGWIRFVDGSDPSTLALPLFADAFPPSLYALVGRVGWVPTVELTVHVRRRPANGWVQARFECDDLVDGRMIETGSLWDADGALVARSRQLGLLLQD